jgi:hypothetical protein
MKTINEQEFRGLCEDVSAEAPAILRGTTAGQGGLGPLNEQESTGLLFRALFVRLCRHLRLDPEVQASELGDDNGFGLMQTLEEHMEPEFRYSRIIDETLNRRR